MILYNWQDPYSKGFLTKGLLDSYGREKPSFYAVKDFIAGNSATVDKSISEPQTNTTPTTHSENPTLTMNIKYSGYDNAFNYIISGRIYYPDGTPIADTNLRLFFRRQGTNEWIPLNRFNADANGNYEITYQATKAEAGNQYSLLVKSDYYEVFSGWQSLTIESQPETDTTPTTNTWHFHRN